MNARVSLRRKKCIFLVMAALVLLILVSGPGFGNQWLLFYGEQIKGRVIDAETGSPIENVIVVGMWRLSQFLSQGFGGYGQVILVKTDKEGAFSIPSWITFKPWTFNSAMHDSAPEIVIYKPGYRLYYSLKAMREGYPNDLTIAPAEKKKVIEEYSLQPAKLRKITKDEERLENYELFELKADFPGSHYSRIEARDIVAALEQDIMQISDTNERKKRLQANLNALR